MKNEEIDEILLQTLDDLRVSRSEKQALTALFADHVSEPSRLAFFRNRAFAVARRELGGGKALLVLDWLEEVVKAIDAAGRGDDVPLLAEAHFSPGERCPRRIISLFGSAMRAVDICVFTLTDDRITRAVLEAHQRGVRVRLITDDLKREDPGSDTDDLARAGVEVRMDSSENHMHHKFAIFDGACLLTGSYNWTRSAARLNEENLVVINTPRLIQDFQETFERLWRAYAP